VCETDWARHVLLVDEVECVADYYRDKLGFEVTFYEENPRRYAYASRDDVRIRFVCLRGEVVVP
jgi:hypothetical protein